MSKQKIAKYQRYLAEIEKLSDEQMQELSKEIFRRGDIPKEAIKRRISVLRQAEDFGFRGSEISKLDSFFERIASDSHFGESRTSDVSSATTPKSLGSFGVGSESDSEAATRSVLYAPLSERSSDSEGGEDEERGGSFTAEDIKEVENLTEEEIEKLSLEIMFSVVDKDTLLEYLQGEHDLEEISKVREFISDSRARARSKISEEEKILVQFDKDKAKFKKYGIELPVFEVKLPAGFLEEFGPLVEKYSTHEGKSSVVFKGGKLSGGEKFFDRSRDKESSKTVEDSMLKLHECVWKYILLCGRGSNEWNALMIISKTLEGLRPELCNQENAIVIMNRINSIKKSMNRGVADSVSVMGDLAAGRDRRSEGSAFGGGGRSNGSRRESDADAVPRKVKDGARDIVRAALSSMSINTKTPPTRKERRMTGKDDLGVGVGAVTETKVKVDHVKGGGGRKGRKRG